MTTSRRSKRERVAAWRSLSISSLISNLLLDEGVGAGEIGFGLVVIVVADEVLHGVFGEELLELGGKLGGQGLVVADDQRGPFRPRDDVSHGEGLAAAGNAEQGLVLKAFIQTFHQLIHRLGLVASHPEVGDNLEVGHTNSIAFGDSGDNALDRARVIFID